MPFLPPRESASHNIYILMEFELKSIPKISYDKYRDKFKTFIDEDIMYHVADIYVQRWCDITDTMLSTFNEHKLFLVALLIAHKFWDDEAYDNTPFAEVGGINVQELNDLEFRFLSNINFKLVV